MEQENFRFLKNVIYCRLTLQKALFHVNAQSETLQLVQQYVERFG